MVPTTANSLTGGPGLSLGFSRPGHLAMRLKEQGRLQLPFFPRANQPFHPFSHILKGVSRGGSKSIVLTQRWQRRGPGTPRSYGCLRLVGTYLYLGRPHLRLGRVYLCLGSTCLCLGGAYLCLGGACLCFGRPGLCCTKV